MADFIIEDLKQVANCKLCQIRGVEMEATHFCVDCNSHICGACEIKHREVSFLQKHVVGRVTVGPACDAAIFCQAHLDQRATYWCATCTNTVCTSCMIYEHDGHDGKDITNYFSDLATDGQTFERSILNLKKNFLSTLSVIKDIVCNLDAQVTISEGAIRLQCRAMIKQIKKAEQHLIKQLKAAQQYKLDNLKNEANQLVHNVDEINKWVDKKTSLYSSGDNNSIIPKLSDLVSKGKTLSTRELVSVPATDFVKFKANDSMNIGELSVRAGCLNKKPLWHLQGEKGETTEYISLISDDMLAVLFDKSIKLYAIHHDNVAPTMLSATSVGDHTMAWMAACGLTLYVTCSHHNCKTVHQYTITEGSLVKNTKQWQTNMFHDPCGIAVTKSHNVIVSDFDRKEVTMHSSDGTRLLTIGNDTNVSFLKPSYVAIGTDCIIVSDWGNHYIYVFDMGGKLKTKFGGEGNEDAQLDEPHGVCTDREDNILVADENNGRISQFDSQGHFTCHILSKHFANISSSREISLREIGPRQFLVVNDEGQRNPGIKMFEI